MVSRKHDRHEIFCRVNWDYFTARTGAKSGFIANISQGGCLLKTREPIEHRRWLRLAIPSEAASNLWVTAIGRVIRIENKFEVHSESDSTLYQHGIEFTQAGAGDVSQDLDWIFALSSRNLTVRSCLSLNSKSSLRSEFLA